jgi:peptidoglycan/xylan/chitin deacetylase (PgdA/CDA1 family)
MRRRPARRLRLLEAVYSQSFLILVATLCLIILSASSIHADRHKNNKSKGSTLALSVKNQRVRPQQVRVKPPAPSVASAPPHQTVQLEPLQWQGPIQPMPTLAPAAIPVLDRISTTEPVVFLGIDDGWIQTKDSLAWLIGHHLPFTLFLTNNGIKNNYGYFQQLQAAGMVVENHTLSHPDLTRLTLAQQRAEICGTADIFANVFGRRPTLFRPPYGAMNNLTRQAAAECGMKAIIMWHAKVSDGAVQFQDKNTDFLPGDIVLMHFHPEFAADIKAFTDQVEKDHLQVGRLEDWIQ